MKRLLTTAMVLVMLVTMFCASPVVTAAGNPEMIVKVINTDNLSNDTITATFTDVSDAMWVVWSVRKESGEYLYIEERRGNKAEASPFEFIVDSTEKAALQTENSGEKLIVEAKISYSTGEPIPLPPKVFEYNTYVKAQTIVDELMLGDISLKEASDKLVLPLPKYYIAIDETDEIDELIVSSLNPFTGDISAFYDDLSSKILINCINTKDASIIENILSNFYTEIGGSVSDPEKSWYNALLNKNKVATRLASYTFDEVEDLRNQFKALVFLEELAKESISDVMKFIETYANTYINYGDAVDGKLDKDLLTSPNLSLDFSSTGYDKDTLSLDHQEFAASFMLGSYANLNALNTKFNDPVDGLLAKLRQFQTGTGNDPTPSLPSTPPESSDPSGILGSSGSSGSSVSVGLVNPIVGGNSNPFSDIDDVEWAREAIIALAKEGVIEGVSAKSYQPNANVTREQFVKIIVNTFGLKGSGAVAAFEDVDQKEWYASYINTAVELGIIKGTSDLNFGVGQNISRQDMTLIMYRVAKYVGVDVTAKSGRTFTDSNSIDSYAIDAVTALYRAGIVNGVADGVFGGRQTATRAQAAKLCYDLRESK